MHCPSCNTLVGDSDRFCTICGTALALTAGPPPGADAPLQTPAGGVTEGPTTLELASSVGARRSRAGTVLLLLLYAVLFAGAAWGTFTYLSHRTAEQASLTLGTPRLVRVAEPAEPAVRPPSRKSSGKSRKKPGARRSPRGEAPKPARAAKPGGEPPTEPAPAAAAVDDHEAPAEEKQPAPDASPATTPAAKPDKPAPSPEENMERFRASLNAESVRMVIKHYLPQLRVCYERASKKGAFGGGVVEVQFVVGTNGKVTRAQVIRNSTGSKDMGTCIAGAFKRWRFPRPVGGEMEFIYPFVFASGG